MKAKTNPLLTLSKAGVSVWADYIRRGWLLDGSLRKLVDQDAIGGLTSNPTIFEKAIAGGSDYDKTLEALAVADVPVLDMFETVAVEDIQMAADPLLPRYEATKGADGFVSLEVHPNYANSTGDTIATARKLFQLAGRKNVMIKVPGTREGLEAIETLIGEGMNINVTLLFSAQRYREVQEAYLKGLERLERSGKDLSTVSSVASFFVSRVDTAIDKQIEEKIAASKDAKQKKTLSKLLGKAGIANCKLAYKDYLTTFTGARFRRLQAKGARVQRLLWASTGTKNPDYRDVLYVEQLIGKDTVNTMPLATMDAFRHHGLVKPAIEKGLPEAKAQLEALEAAGISLSEVTKKLELDGVRLFIESYDNLLKAVSAKKEAIRAVTKNRPGWRESFDTEMANLKKARFNERLWKHDPTLWSNDPKHQKIILNRLGWLRSPQWAEARVGEMEDFVAACRKAGYKTAVLLGMGGSSLAPEVYSKVFGTKKGYLQLKVLDTTDPRSILAVEKSIDLNKTLFLVSSKSGGTLEVQSLFKYFYEKLEAKKGKKAGAHFAAVTDPDTILGQQAKQYGFRKVFINPADVGGRYSALSYFGLVPAALLGVDLRLLLSRTLSMVDRSWSAVPPLENPGIRVGVGLSVLGREGRDKVTFIMSKQIQPFGDWVEQLIAESTGKEGKELFPVVNEVVAPAESYGADRAFVIMGLAGDKAMHKKAAELERSSQSVLFWYLQDAYDLGGEFFRWEVATVVAGAMLAIDAFDEPNVQESKDNTAELLKIYEQKNSLPDEPHTFEQDGLTVYGGKGDSLAAILAEHFKTWTSGDYIALLAYLQKTPSSDKELGAMRLALRDAFKAAVTVGYGPRFLHSTGQLHKGGKNNGVFLQVTCDDPKLEIPGSPFDFSTLKAAQALGDLRALRNKGRRSLRVHLHDPQKGLKTLRLALEQAVRTAAHA